MEDILKWSMRLTRAATPRNARFAPTLSGRKSSGTSSTGVAPRPSRNIMGFGTARCCGTVFKLTSTRLFKVLYTFTGGNDGGNPAGHFSKKREKVVTDTVISSALTQSRHDNRFNGRFDLSFGGIGRRFNFLVSAQWVADLAWIEVTRTGRNRPSTRSLCLHYTKNVIDGFNGLHGSFRTNDCSSYS